MKHETVGISPKATAASLVVAAGTLATVVVLWLVTGEFDKAELTTALTGFIGSAAAFAAAYLASPGTVRERRPRSATHARKRV